MTPRLTGLRRVVLCNGSLRGDSTPYPVIPVSGYMKLDQGKLRAMLAVTGFCACVCAFTCACAYASASGEEISPAVRHQAATGHPAGGSPAS